VIDFNNENIAHIKAMLAGLIMECPSGGNPNECQFYDRRKLPLQERIRWLDSILDDECLRIYKLHCDCLSQKENKKCAVTSS